VEESKEGLVMMYFRIVRGIWVLSVVVFLALILMSGSLPPGPPERSSHAALVADFQETGMLQGDTRMLEWMRAAISPSMNGMIELDPMWADSDMIQAQEQYQAQIDRMLARP
jgi:hypothetical protein